MLLVWGMLSSRSLGDPRGHAGSLWRCGFGARSQLRWGDEFVWVLWREWEEEEGHVEAEKECLE